MTHKTLDEYLKQTTANTTAKQQATKPKHRITGFYRETEFQETPIGKIPKQWKISRLEHLASAIYYGVTAKAVEHNTGLKMLRTTDIKDYKVDWDSLPYCEITSKVNDIKKYLLRKGDLIVARAGTVGVSVLVDRNFDNTVFGSYLIKVRPKENLVYPKFLHYYFQSKQYWKHISKAQGSTLKNINLGILKSLPVPIPPLEEQWGIADVLSALDRAIEATEKLIERLERLKRGLMQELLTRGIGHREYKETPIGKIPKEWKIVTLERIAEIVNGYTFPLELQGKKAGKYPFIKVGDMNNSYKYVTRAENYVDNDDLRKLRARVFPKGTIIFPKIGMAMKLNKFRILGCDALFDNNVAGLIPKNVNNEFLYYYFSGKVNLISLAGTTTVPSITKTRLRKLLIPLPPLEEQKQISAILSSIDEWIELEKRRKEKFERLKRGLMELLLTGRVRVRVERLDDMKGSSAPGGVAGP